MFLFLVAGAIFFIQVCFFLQLQLWKYQVNEMIGFEIKFDDIA